MNKDKNKFNLSMWILIIIVGVICAIIPNAGKFVLVNELLNIMFILAIATYVIVIIVRLPKYKKKSEQIFRVGIISVVIILPMVFSKNLVLDIIQGPKEIIVYHPSTSKYSGTSGMISLHYYLHGKDENGRNIRIEITAEDYNKNYGSYVNVRYYENICSAATISRAMD